jgi:hypothetical protein
MNVDWRGRQPITKRLVGEDTNQLQKAWRPKLGAQGWASDSYRTSPTFYRTGAYRLVGEDANQLQKAWRPKLGAQVWASDSYRMPTKYSIAIGPRQPFKEAHF